MHSGGTEHKQLVHLLLVMWYDSDKDLKVCFLVTCVKYDKVSEKLLRTSKHPELPWEYKAVKKCQISEVTESINVMCQSDGKQVPNL